MQVNMKNIRCLGNNKIASAIDIKDFLNELQRHIDLVPVTVYSVPKRYLEGTLKVSRIVKRVLKYCEPMIDTGVSNSEALQRKFRNTWNNIWNCFVSDNNLGDEVFYLLQNVGLTNLPESVVNKLEAIVIWYFVSLSEESLRDINQTMDTILKLLVCLDNHYFLRFYLTSIKKEVI